MSRTPQFMHPVPLKLHQIELALIRYYAERYRKDQTALIRGMIRAYVRADLEFDPKAFMKFVEAQLIPEQEDDERMQSEIRRQTSEFVAAYPKR